MRALRYVCLEARLLHLSVSLQWYFENLDNDIIRVSHKIGDESFMFEPGTHTHGAPLDQQCEPNDWIVKETEVKGAYT